MCKFFDYFIDLFCTVHTPTYRGITCSFMNNKHFRLNKLDKFVRETASTVAATLSVSTRSAACNW